MKLTDLFGKQVFALYEGEIIGTICNSVFNSELTKVVSLKMFDNEENEFEIKFNSIKAMNDCIIIANKEKLGTFLERSSKTPMFKPVITEDAVSFGKIIDCEIEKDGKIINFLTDNNSHLEPTKINLRKNFIYYSKTKLLNKNITPKKNNLPLENIKVNILNFDTSLKSENFIPNKLQYNTDTILGKVAKDTLFGINNEVIIRANQIINEKTIEDASRHNRLNQLYFIAN